jgi:hypothetical protein
MAHQEACAIGAKRSVQLFAPSSLAVCKPIIVIIIIIIINIGPGHSTGPVPTRKQLNMCGMPH